jgi:cold-inducible RNA-binding protein
LAVRLFVGNLSYSTTEADLRSYFSTVAPPSHVVLPVDRETGRPRGFAFVEFLDRAHAEQAIQKFNGQALNGRPLSVSEARAREDRGPGGPPRPGGPPGAPRPGGFSSGPPRPGGFSGPPRPGGFSGPPRPGGFAPRPFESGQTTPAAIGRAKNFGPDAKPQRGGQKGKKKEDQRPRGPIPVKTDRRSYSLEDDSPEVKLDDFDDFATSKPELESDDE